MNRINRLDNIRSFVFFGLLFFLIIGFAYIVRIYRIEWGLPYLYYWDEPQTASNALRMLKTGDFHPYFFNYGTLPTYINYFVNIFHYLYLMGQPETAPAYLKYLSDIKVWSDTKFQWSISHPSFYYWNRYTTALLYGVGSCCLTYLICKNIFNNKWIALVAVLFVASVGPHIEFSALITPDLPASFFVLAATLFTLYFLDNPKTTTLSLSLICVGAAIACKYNSALVSLLPLMAVILQWIKNRQGFNFRWWALLPVVPVVTFFICMPYALIASSAFLSDLGWELRHYRILGHGPFSSIPGIRHIKFQFANFLGAIGVIGCVGAAIGLATCISRPKLAFILILPLAHFFYMTTMKVNFHRNFLVIYPFIAICYSGAVLLLWHLGVYLSKRFTNVGVRKVIELGLPFLAIAYLVSLAYGSMLDSIKVKNVVDSRTQIVQEINMLKPQHSIYVPREIMMHEQDLRKFRYPYKELPLKDIFSCDGQDPKSFVVIPAELSSNPTDPADQINLSSAYPHWMKNLNEKDAILNIGSTTTFLNQFSVNPKLYVFQKAVIRKSNPNCAAN